LKRWPSAPRIDELNLEHPFFPPSVFAWDDASNVSVAGFPAPARIGVQMYSQGIRCKMIANLQSYALTINQGDPTPI
jgi:hypothetical protein